MFGWERSGKKKGIFFPTGHSFFFPPLFYLFTRPTIWRPRSRGGRSVLLLKVVQRWKRKSALREREASKKRKRKEKDFAVDSDKGKKTALLLRLSLFLSLTVSRNTSNGEAKIVPILAKKVCRAVFYRGVFLKSRVRKKELGGRKAHLLSLSLFLFASQPRPSLLSLGFCVSSMNWARIRIEGFSS